MPRISKLALRHRLFSSCRGTCLQRWNWPAVFAWLTSACPISLPSDCSRLKATAQRSSKGSTPRQADQTIRIACLAAYSYLDPDYGCSFASDRNRRHRSYWPCSYCSNFSQTSRDTLRWARPVYPTFNFASPLASLAAQLLPSLPARIGSRARFGF